MQMGKSAVAVDVAGDAADRGMRRFTGLLRAGVNPRAKATKDWSVRDVAAHIAGFLALYIEMIGGARSPVPSLDRLGESNADYLAVEEQNLYNFADDIDRAMAALLKAADAAGSDVPVHWHGGLTLPLSTILGLIAGEGYVHGYDIARSARVPWTVPADDAVSIITAALPVFPALVDEERARGVTASVEVRLRGADDGRWAFNFNGGRLTIDRAVAGRPDWTMSSAPEAFLLASYGRMSPARAVLTGKVVAWGRRPDVGLRFNSLFKSV